MRGGSQATMTDDNSLNALVTLAPAWLIARAAAPFQWISRLRSRPKPKSDATDLADNSKELKLGLNGGLGQCLVHPVGQCLVPSGEVSASVPSLRAQISGTAAINRSPHISACCSACSSK